MPVGEDDRGRPGSGVEVQGGGLLDRRARAGDAGVDQHPAAVAGVARATEDDVDDGEPAVDEASVELDRAVGERIADLDVFGDGDLLGHACARSLLLVCRTATHAGCSLDPGAAQRSSRETVDSALLCGGHACAPLRAAHTGDPVPDFEAQLRRDDGSSIDVIVTAPPLVSARPAPLGETALVVRFSRRKPNSASGHGLAGTES